MSYSEKTAIDEPGSSPQKSAGSLNSDLLASKSVRNTPLLFLSHPVYGIFVMAVQTYQTSTLRLRGRAEGRKHFRHYTVIIFLFLRFCFLEHFRFIQKLLRKYYIWKKRALEEVKLCAFRTDFIRNNSER